MSNGDVRGKAVYGSETTGADSYATVIAAPTAPREYRHVIVYVVGLNAAMFSFDGGVTDSLYVPGGNSGALDNLQIVGAVQAKNGDAGSAYTKVHVSVW